MPGACPSPSARASPPCTLALDCARSPTRTRAGTRGTTRYPPPARRTPRRCARRSRSARCVSWENAPMSIVQNRKASHHYFVEERYEAGLVLEGWEVKAVRAGRAQIGEAYVIVKDGALWMIGAHISPLLAASTHVKPDPTRTRKLLMHAEEIRRLIGKVEQRGYTLIPLDLHFAKGRIKLQIALAKGKLKHDKRASEREKEWQREKTRILRNR